MLERAGLDQTDELFALLFKAGVFAADENVELLRLGAPVEFPPEVRQAAAELAGAARPLAADSRRQDLTDLSLFTIDGQSTLDFDDALSLEATPEGLRLGVHIVRRGARGSQRRPNGSGGPPPRQLDLHGGPENPNAAAGPGRGLCSLKAGEVRPAISTVVDLSPS